MGSSTRLAIRSSLLLGLLSLSGSVFAQVADDYRLRLGDTIRVLVADQEELTQEIMVFTKGQMSYPGIGKVVFWGVTPAELEKSLAEKLAGQGILDAEVSVLILSIEPGRVYIQGAISQPQAVELPTFRPLLLSQLIAMSGGLTSDAEPRSIKVQRLPASGTGPKQTLTVNYADVANGLNAAGDVELQDGDTIFVATRVPETFALSGEVRNPGEYLMPAGTQTTLSRALLRGRGFTDYANIKKVKLVRGTQEYVVNCADMLKDGDLSKDMQILAGDFIIVPRSIF